MQRSRKTSLDFLSGYLLVIEFLLTAVLCSNLGNKILMQAIFNVHTACRFATPAVEQIVSK